MPATFRITLAYDGTDFNGWQRQPDGTSIQALLEDALRELDGRDVTVTGAGRTDAGVHALAQVAAFSLERTIDPAAVVRAVNVRLPESVRIVSAAIVDAEFHPRFDATSKRYRYRIWNADVVSPFERRYAWHIIDRLDVEAMNAAAALLVGTHDFAAFCGTGSDAATTTRTIMSSRIAECGVRDEAECGMRDESVIPSAIRPSAIRNPQSALLEYDVTGSGFLRYMVRNIVGSLVDIGRGRMPPAWLGQVLASRDRTKAGRTAPAHGLFLVGVKYE
jgi:tRNA pseudouridine38-40 synthase